jgi:hypothetical protein
MINATFRVARPGKKARDPDVVQSVDTRVPWAPEDPTNERPAHRGRRALSRAVAQIVQR